ncbi:MAG: hypothetical protein FXF54_02085 [Kosmotoga sp.]|nr:MAG: hypothetical protein FXF54_02085 [Kosmotoga sp.]
MKRILLCILVVFVIIFLLTACSPKEVLHLYIEIESEEDATGEVYPSEGEYLYYKGMTQTIAATPSENAVFVKWMIDGFEESKSSTTITINKDITATAYFEKEKPEYTLTVLESYGEGKIEPSAGTYKYIENEEVTLIATPSNGWDFEKWQVDGLDYSTDESTTIIIDKNKQVQAFFEKEPIKKYTLTMFEPEGQGTTSPASGTYSYEENTEVTIEATPNEEWKFIKWEVNGEFYSTQESTTLFMNSNKEAKAFFASESEGYILTTIAEGNGWIKIIPEKETYSDGEKVELEAIPGDCASFEKWHGDILSENKVIELIMDSDKFICAYFKEKDNPPSIEITSPEPVPEYVSDLSQEFEFVCYSNNEDVNISEISADVSIGEALLNYQIDEDSGYGTLIWDFGTDKTINCQSYYATITVKDSCENIGSKPIQIKVDNVSPELDFEVGDFKVEEDYIETDLTWIATDSCLNKVSFGVNKGTITELHSFNNKGSNIWKIPLDEINESDLVVTVTAHDKAGNTESVSKVIPVSKLSMRVNPESAGIVSPVAGDHYYPSSVKIDLSATPDPEYAFDKWETTAGSLEDANSPETVFVMPDQNATITANFATIWKGFSENVSKIGQVSNVEVDKPVNIEEGDMIVVIIHTQNRINNDWVNDPLSSQGFSLIGHSVDESNYERPTVTAAYKIAGNNEPSSYSFKISEEMHWYIAAICINKSAGIGGVVVKDSGENSVETITFDSVTTTSKSLVMAAITQRRSTESDYNARSFVVPQGMTERYSNYSIGTDKPSTSGASQFLKAGETIHSPTYSWDYTGRATGIMFEIFLEE